MNIENKQNKQKQNKQKTTTANII